jgi:hypothetical protein
MAGREIVVRAFPGHARSYEANKVDMMSNFVAGRRAYMLQSSLCLFTRLILVEDRKNFPQNFQVHFHADWKLVD